MAWKENAKTKHVALNMLKAGVAITGAALLFACGDDDSSFVASENGGSAAEADIDVATFDYLPNCTDKREGKTAYIKDEKATYVCVDGDWITGSISESVDDLINCTSKHEGETAYIKDEKATYVCTDGDWVVAGESGDEGDEGDDDGDDAGQKSSSSKAKSADSKGKSSSSEGVGSASSSSSSRGFFDMTKDEFLNPKVTYGELLDERDYQMYKTVEICDDKNENCQTWMAQNLNYAYTGVAFDNGYYTSDSTSWCYDDDPSNCATYGRLYTWAAAVDSVAIYKNYGEECGYWKFCTRFSASALATAPVRGVCPSGWHLPSNAEWGALYTNVGGASYAGQKLKANTSLWTSYSGVTNDDSFGFSVLPAGNRGYYGDFYGQGRLAFFWSSTEYKYFWSSTEYKYNGSDAWSQYFNYDYDYADQESYGKYNAFSVRCLQN